MSKESSSSGLSLSTVLTVIFIVLKLTGVIDWSWWWILSPTLISLGFLGVFLICVLIAHISSERDATRAAKEKPWVWPKEKRKGR